MSTLHEDSPDVHYRQKSETPAKRAGRSGIVEGDISEHADALIRQARLNLKPGKTAFQVAADVAERTAEDFDKHGAPLEAEFVREVRDAVLIKWEEHRQASRPAVRLDGESDLIDAWLDGVIPDEHDGVYDQYTDEDDDEVTYFPSAGDSEPDARRRPWRETYATLSTIERRVLLAGVACIGIVSSSVVYAITSALL